MTAATFDTLAALRELTASGIPEKQAEAMIHAFQQAHGQLDLATKQDVRESLAEIKQLLSDMELRLTVRMGIGLTVVVSVLALVIGWTGR